MMRVLVFGQTGQVATELARQAAPDMAMTCMGRDRADLSDPAACAAVIAASDADVVINAAAYTAVDRAESAEDLATTINGTAPGAMAAACKAAGIPFLHVSTDYVFDGSGTRPWQPDDATGPLGAYGRSKLAGEQAVRAAGGAHAITRTSWVFSAHGANFVKTMLRLGAERDKLTIVADQIGGPTAAADIAAALLTMARARAPPAPIISAAPPMSAGPISRARSSCRQGWPARSRTFRPRPIPRLRAVRATPGWTAQA